MVTVSLCLRFLGFILPVGLSILLSGCICKPVQVKAEQKAALREGGMCRAKAVKAPAEKVRPEVEVPKKEAPERKAAPPAAKETSEEKLIRLAKSDHTAFLEKCLEHYRDHYRDYTCTFIKQERLNGNLGSEQTIEAKFMGDPFSVVLHWVENSPGGDLAIYVEGENNDKMIVHPEGIGGILVNCLRVSPTSKQAMQQSRYPITNFGFAKMLETFISTNRRAQAAGDFRPEWGGTVTVEETGRSAILLIRHLPNNDDYPAELTKTWVDTEYLVPVEVEGYDWSGQLSYHYIFKDIQFNVGLSPDDFTPQANGLNCGP